MCPQHSIPQMTHPGDYRTNWNGRWTHPFSSPWVRRGALHHIDLFESPMNSQLPRFTTWKHHRTAVGHDALRHPWKKLGNLYPCPPWNLIPQILQRLQQESTEATLSTSFWS